MPIYACRESLYRITCEKWPQANDAIRQQMARMASTAAWGLGGCVDY